MQNSKDKKTKIVEILIRAAIAIVSLLTGIAL